MRTALIILLVVLAHTAIADEPKPPELSLDQLASSVVFLRTPIAPKRTAVGTGFLANLQGRIFLITASHVAAGTTSKSDVTISVVNDRARTVSFDTLLSDRWVTHESADVAVAEINPPPDLVEIFRSRGLPLAVFVGDLFSPPRGRPLTIVGFPLGLGVDLAAPDSRISAITKETKAASGLLTLPRADTKKPSTFFVIDSPSIGGFSGAPVFVAPGAFSSGPGLTFSAASLCVGLVHGTLSDDTGGKLAAIVPSRFIVEALQHAFAKY